MPPAISPKKTARRHHPAQSNARPHRPIHPSPNPPSQQSQPQSYAQRDMAATSSSHYTSYPGPYVQPRQLGSSRSMPAPPPHILPQSFLPPPSTEYILPILPQRHAGYALETLSDAAFSLTTSANQPPPPRDPEDLRPVKPTITRINPASIPHVEGILPQYPPGYVPKDIETYVIAPHQIPDMSLPPLPPAEPTTGSLEQYRTVAAGRPKSKPRKKRFGEVSQLCFPQSVRPKLMSRFQKKEIRCRTDPCATLPSKVPLPPPKLELLQTGKKSPGECSILDHSTHHLRPHASHCLSSKVNDLDDLLVVRPIPGGHPNLTHSRNLDRLRRTTSEGLNLKCDQPSTSSSRPLW